MTDTENAGCASALPKQRNMEANALYAERKLPLECKTVWRRWRIAKKASFCQQAAPLKARFPSWRSSPHPQASLRQERRPWNNMSIWQKPLALNFPFCAKYLSKISVKLPALSFPKELAGCAKAMYRVHQALTGNTEKSAS